MRLKKIKKRYWVISAVVLMGLTFYGAVYFNLIYVKSYVNYKIKGRWGEPVIAGQELSGNSSLNKIEVNGVYALIDDNQQLLRRPFAKKIMQMGSQGVTLY